MTETLYIGGAAGYDEMFARVTQAFVSPCFMLRKSLRVSAF